MKILVTGTAGFIGYHVAIRLLGRGDEVVGLDTINDYYDVNLKYARLRETGINKDEIFYKKMIQSIKYQNYKFIKLNLEDRENIEGLFKSEKFDNICHLAAQAGVRYSMTNPYAYINSNIHGFINILEGCRYNKADHLVYASSSSVYGINTKLPFSTSDNVDHPISLYAATKKANELMAHTYSHLYGMPTTGLRFFTVYGPWGRPDMALFIFTKSILDNKPIYLNNHGDMTRDFTYVDDIVEGVLKVIDNKPHGDNSWSSFIPNPSTSSAPYKLYNIGNNSPVNLKDFVTTLEEILSKKAIIHYLPMQAGDVQSTHADVTDLMKSFNYKPTTPIKKGIENFVKWYLGYYNVDI